MNVLDIDLDLFVDDRAIGSQSASLGQRLDGNLYHPWSEHKVRFFLEDSCRLSRKFRVSGSLHERHDEVFWALLEMIDTKRLQPPFSFVHVDAHADLGLGDHLGVNDICGRFLRICDIDKRIDAIRQDPDKVREGNFLLYTLACCWVSQLTYVHHENLKPLPEHLDIPDPIMKDCNKAAAFIQLKGYSWDDVQSGERLSYFTPTSYEPVIEFVLADSEKFQAECAFDFCFVSKSPEYTPEAADELIPVLNEYIDLEIW